MNEHEALFQAKEFLDRTLDNFHNYLKGNNIALHNLIAHGFVAVFSWQRYNHAKMDIIEMKLDKLWDKLSDPKP